MITVQPLAEKTQRRVDTAFFITRAHIHAHTHTHITI